MATAPANLSEIVHNALVLALSGWEHLTIDTFVDAPQSVFVDVDRVQIEQVLINLVRNAAEAMTLCAWRTLKITATEQGEFAEIAIQDSGPGLPEEVRMRLFQPVASGKPDGMGLGLSICRTIIEAHGGEILADENCAGACFRLSLPLAEPGRLAS